MAALPSSADLVSLLRVAVAAAPSADPLRYDTRGAAVLHTARGLLATMVQALPRQDGGPPPAPTRRRRPAGRPAVGPAHAVGT